MSNRALYVVLALLLPACDPGEPVPTGDGPLGRPDAMHGDPTDADIDGDGVANDADVCPSLANADQTDRCDYTLPPTGVTDGLERLNFWRSQLGLEAVTEDTELSAACAAHLDYLQQYAVDTGQSVYLSHEEDPSVPYYTEAGANAGINSVLSYGQMSAGEAVDGWLDTLYHRIPLLHPGLRRVGVAFENRYSCMEYRTGTEAAPAPHPIFWPIADSSFTRPIFGGNESPCPTLEDPLSGDECPGSAAIASVGLNGAFSDVSATITRLDTGEDFPLFHIWYDGGPSPHEQMGYLEGTIALVPEVDSVLASATYEANVNVTIDGSPENIRWRFSVGSIDQTIACDLFGNQSDFMRAVPVTAASINGRVCATSDFYRIRDAGTYDVSLQYNRRVGALELIAYDEAQNEIGRSAEADGTGALMGLPGMSYIEVRGAGGAMGGYILVIE